MLYPLPTRESAEAVLRLVAGLATLEGSGEGLGPLEIEDLDPVFSRLQIAGSQLDPEEFLSLRPLLGSSRRVRQILERSRAKFPDLADLGASLHPLPHIERALDETLDPSGQVKDGASGTLKRIRREREQKRERLRGRMERLASKLGGADTAVLVTLREDRYALTVPQEQKGKIRGLILDRSSSGATFYMEPLEVVEDNNALRELEVEEREETRRILAALTETVRQEQEALRQDWEQLGRVDALRARALLAVRLGGEVPVFSETSRLKLEGARHPLLLEARGAGEDLEKARAEVVPLALELEAGENRILLITGPNMGGKTVALKTLGLLSAMAESGCLIPANPGCVLPWVKDWSVSLGDEQSLEQDLSTFAGHLRGWAWAMEVAGPDAMVLLDELGSGTDPTEGAALAQSVLERLAGAGGLGLVTTHLGTLKAFAAQTEGMQNASMAFDARTRKPTYELRVGTPGESHAMDMARGLGFPPERVARAEELLPEEERDVRKLLQELETERRQLEVAREAAERDREAAKGKKEEHRQQFERLMEERAGIRAKAARQAQDLIRRAEETLRRAEKSARKGKRPEDLGRARLAREHARLSRLAVPRSREMAGEVPDTVAIGQNFWAEVLGRIVEVVETPDGGEKVVVVSNGLRVTLPRTGLRVLGETGPEAPAPPPRTELKPEVEDPPFEVDLRGLRVEESLSRLDRALDQALLAGLTEIRVIHGKGTGALKDAVEAFCRSHQGVNATREAERWRGGAGATVIELEG